MKGSQVKHRQEVISPWILKIRQGLFELEKGAGVEMNLRDREQYKQKHGTICDLLMSICHVPDIMTKT
jgi:hypothetical protein